MLEVGDTVKTSQDEMLEQTIRKAYLGSVGINGSDDNLKADTTEGDAYGNWGPMRSVE